MTLKRLLVPLLILLALVAYLVFSLNEKSNSDQPFSDFSIADTATINQVRISNTLGDKIIIQRRNEKNTWKVEDSDISANKEAIDRILSTLHQWKVVQDVEENQRDNSIELLSVKHHKVEVFKDNEDKPFKTYYIGDANKSMTGNLALLKVGEKKSNIPYYIQVPGFYGTLETRFFTKRQDWRSHEIIGLEPQEIKEIQLKVFEQPQESYTIRQKAGQLSLYDANDSIIPEFDTLSLRRHLSAFKILYLERFVDYLPATVQDSIIQSQPKFILNTTDKNGQKVNVRVYCFPNVSGNLAPDGTELECSPERLYALANEKDFITIQRFGWGAVFKPLSFFLKP